MVSIITDNNHTDTDMLNDSLITIWQMLTRTVGGDAQYDITYSTHF